MKTAAKTYVYAMILAVAILTMLFSSCVTEKKRLKICQTCPLKIDRKDSIVYKDSIREVPVTVTVAVQVQTPNPCAELCDSAGKLKPGFSRVIPGKNGTRARMFTRNDSLILEALADSAKALAKVRDRYREHFHSTLEQVPARCEKAHLTKWDSFLIICGKIWLWMIGFTLLAVLVKWKVFPGR